MNGSLKNLTWQCISEIQQAIENNKLVIFVGAGVSRNSGIPSWNELVTSMASDLNSPCPNNISVSDYLKIPQLYFNEFGQHKYTCKVNEILNLDVAPNQIHNLIFSLNPQHIVTTNYDNLLEKEAEVLRIKKYAKVATNKDLADARSNKFIIKMHGEFGKPFVLKESDYDSYSTNFKLIENYVKGIFSAYTVLFIGFSGDDPNIRKLRQWVKDILHEDARVAYLIDTSDYSKTSAESIRVDFAYFKSQGIYKIYYDELLTHCNLLKRKTDKASSSYDLTEGERLYGILELIKKYKRNDIKSYCSLICNYLKTLNYIPLDCYAYVFDEKRPVTKFELELFLSCNRLNIQNPIFDRLKIVKAFDEVEHESKESEQSNISKESMASNDSGCLDKKEIIMSDVIDLLHENSFLCDFSYDDFFYIYECYQKISPEFNEYTQDYEERFDLDANDFAKIKDIVTRVYNHLLLVSGNISLNRYDFEKVHDVFKAIERSISLIQDTHDFGKDDSNLIYKKVLFFDYDGWEHEKSNQGLDLFKTPYALYLQNRYDEALVKLNEISLCYYNSPVIYYLSEFNKHCILQEYKHSFSFTSHQSSSYSENFFDSEWSEVIDKLPNSLKWLQHVFSEENFNEYNLELLTIQEMIRDGGKTSGLDSIFVNQKLTQLYSLGFSFFYLIKYNYLFVDNLISVKTFFYEFVRTVLLCYAFKQEPICSIYEENSKSKFSVGGCKIQFLDRFELYIIVRYLLPKQLQSLIHEFAIKHINLKCDDDAQYLQSIFQNVLKLMVSSVNNDNVNSLRNIIILFSLVDFENQDYINNTKSFYGALEKICQTNNTQCVRECYTSFNFLLCILEQRKIDLTHHFNFLENILCTLPWPNECNLDVYFKIIQSCLQLIEINNKQSKIICDAAYLRIESIFANPSFSKTAIDAYVESVMPLMYKHSSDKIKKKIDAYLSSKVASSKIDFALYYSFVVLNENGGFDRKKTEQLLIKQFLDNIETRKQSPNLTHSYEITLDNARYLVLLLSVDKWINENYLKQLLDDFMTLTDLFSEPTDQFSFNVYVNALALYVSFDEIDFSSMPIESLSFLSQKRLRKLKGYLKKNKAKKTMIQKNLYDFITSNQERGSIMKSQFSEVLSDLFID